MDLGPPEEIIEVEQQPAVPNYPPNAEPVPKREREKEPVGA